MQRVCFVLQVKREKLSEYCERHSSVWPSMLEALKEAGWKNYTLFLKPDGELIGYFETDDLASSQRKMQMNSINARWQREMSQYFDSLEKGPDQSIVPLAQIFHLD